MRTGIAIYLIGALISGWLFASSLRTCREQAFPNIYAAYGLQASDWFFYVGLSSAVWPAMLPVALASDLSRDGLVCVF